MADSQQHLAALSELNRNYVRAVDEADVAWFDANLATDFFNTNPDGSFLDRKAFLGTDRPRFNREKHSRA